MSHLSYLTKRTILVQCAVKRPYTTEKKFNNKKFYEKFNPMENIPLYNLIQNCASHFIRIYQQFIRILIKNPKTERKLQN